MDEYNNEVGIKYEVKKLDSDVYILIPIDVVKGYSVCDTFYSNNQYQILKNKEDIHKTNIIIDKIVKIDELRNMLAYFEDDIDTLVDCYLFSEANNISVINTKNGLFNRRDINIDDILTSKKEEMYSRLKNGTVVTLNLASLDNLLNIENIDLLKKELEGLKRRLLTFERKGKNASKVKVEDGKVIEIESDKKIQVNNIISNDSATPIERNGDISLRGLERYIKERVFGHDEEIRHIAKTLIMNNTAIGLEKIEPILLVGPTGVGKTETMNAAAEYLGIPYTEVNTINLVPQGIKGESLEDKLYSLIVAANYDLKKAMRGLIFFDEWDKLGSSNTDYKQPIKDILLKFIEGGIFAIDKASDDYLFDTRYLNKVFAGRFKEVFESSNRVLGFNSSSRKKGKDLANLLSDKEYYGKELITRIKHIYLYKELDKETKRRILLESKLSEYLQKKLRYERQFNVTLEAHDSYIDALLNKLEQNQQSIRELNNLVSDTLEEIEYELLDSNYSGKKIILTSDIVEDNRKFVIK